jgi:hypothetical protein
MLSYLDGELTAGEKAAVEEHLRDCANCAELVRRFSTADGKLAGAVDNLPKPIALPAGFVDKTMDKVTSGRRVLRMHRLERFAMAAALLVVVIAGVCLGIRFKQALPVAGPGPVVTVPPQKPTPSDAVPVDDMGKLALLAKSVGGCGSIYWDRDTAEFSFVGSRSIKADTMNRLDGLLKTLFPNAKTVRCEVSDEGKVVRYMVMS